MKDAEMTTETISPDTLTREEVFTLFDTINRLGLQSKDWGLCEDVTSTADFFGYENAPSARLDGRWAYVFRGLNDGYLKRGTEATVFPLIELRVEDMYIDLYKIG